MKDISFKSFADHLAFDKKEIALYKRVTKCKTRKCSKLEKEVDKEEGPFAKGQEKKCTQKSTKAWARCAVDYHKKSKYKILYDKYRSCGEEKCQKEWKAYKTQRKKVQNNIRKNMNSSHNNPVS
jgi:hypothetical protein